MRCRARSTPANARNRFRRRCRAARSGRRRSPRRDRRSRRRPYRLDDEGEKIAEVHPPDALELDGEVVARTAQADVHVARATEILGGVDILVNNAGAARAWPKGTLTIEDEGWVDALSANYLLAVRLSAALLPGMIARNSGVIVNISTVAALIPVPTLAHYGAAKAALNAYSKSLAAEVAPHGVRVNLVVPGNVTTPGADKIRGDFATAFGVEASALTANIPLGRVGAPTDVAAMVGFLVSDRAAWITGTSFVVDGGETPFVR